MKMNLPVLKGFFIAALTIIIIGCAGVNTFPTLARPGDTVSILVGGSEEIRKETIAATLTDSSGQQWDLQGSGAIRSVFSVRPDPRSQGVNYSSYLESVLPWSSGHEAIQTVMITDIPSGVTPGQASISVSTNPADNSAAISQPFTINLEIIPGTGTTDDFQWQNFTGTHLTSFTDIEPAPYGKLDFSTANSGDPSTVGAVSIIVDFDETLVMPGDINVYIPEPVIRPSEISGAAFHGEYQHMTSWKQDGDRAYIHIVAPNGIPMSFLKVYIMHPNTVSGSSIFTLVNSSFYDIDGNLMNGLASLSYFN